MINLLPPDTREAISYARRNSVLRKWAFYFLCVLILVGATIGVGYLYLRQSANVYAAQVARDTQQLKAQKIDETQAHVQSISDSLKLVVQVLSRQVLFSELLKQIGAVMPDGAVLTGLSIEKLQGGIDLQAAANNYQNATQVQINLSDADNKIFEKADIVSVQCTTPPGGSDPFSSQYPCSVQIRALFTKDNPFLFINKTTGQTQ